MRKWIKIEDKEPQDGQEVFYYFDILGVYSGFYEKVDASDIKEGAYFNCFYGKCGSLCDDVTHWMPRSDGDVEPDPPCGD